MRNAYVYIDCISKEVLFVAEAEDQRIADSLVIAHAVKTGINIEVKKAFMEVLVRPLLKEEKK